MTAIILGEVVPLEEAALEEEEVLIHGKTSKLFVFVNAVRHDTFNVWATKSL